MAKMLLHILSIHLKGFQSDRFSVWMHRLFYCSTIYEHYIKNTNNFSSYKFNKHTYNCILDPNDRHKGITWKHIKELCKQHNIIFKN